MTRAERAESVAVGLFAMTLGALGATVAGWAFGTDGAVALTTFLVLRLTWDLLRWRRAARGQS